MKKVFFVLIALTLIAPIGGFADDLDFAAPAGGVCNGGSAIAATTPPLVLACPVSGGPKCDEKEACRCTAVKNAAGGWESENICVKR